MVFQPKKQLNEAVSNFLFVDQSNNNTKNMLSWHDGIRQRAFITYQEKKLKIEKAKSKQK